jgi:TM2 domain-containing membrane protein YozV
MHILNIYNYPLTLCSFVGSLKMCILRIIKNLSKHVSNTNLQRDSKTKY